MKKHNDSLTNEDAISEDSIELTFDLPYRDEKVSSHTDSHKDTASSVADTSDNLVVDDGEGYVYAHYRKHSSRHHHHHHHNDEDDFDIIVRSNSTPHYRVRNKKTRNDKWHQRSWWQKLLIVLGLLFAGIIALILLLAICIIILKEMGLMKLTDYSNIDISAPDIENSVTVTDNGRYVTYKGQEYRFNENMTNILCIGVDKTELGTTDDIVGTGGQGDALYIVSLDTDTGKTTIIAVPRDIVTDIGVYSASGEYIGTEKHQLCLAYAYGDGRKTSCLNTVTAVSRLMYQIPINSYFAVDMSAIADLNDAIGGVTVTLTDDSFYDVNHHRHYKGETLTLYGKNALLYVQQREVRYLESTTERMGHQITYLRSFTSKTIEMTKSDITTPVKLYNIVAENSETNLTTSTITAFATCVVSGGFSEFDFVTVPGTLTSGGTYAEYVVDETALYEMILDIYYDPVA